MAIFSIDYLAIMGVLTVLFAALIYYYFQFLIPYKNLPSHRFELKFFYWMLTKKPLNSILFQNVMETLKRHLSDGICVIWIFKPYVFIFNEETTKLLMNDPGVLNKPIEYKIVDFCLKNAIFVSNGEIWRRMRAFSSPVFQIPIVRDNIDVYNEYSVKLIEQLYLAESHETTKQVAESLNYAFTESVLGLKADNPEDEIKIKSLVESVKKVWKFVAHRMVSPWLYLDFTLHIFSSGRKTLKIIKDVQCTIKEILSKTKESILENQLGETDTHYKSRSVAQELIVQHMKNPSFTLNDVLNQLATIFTSNTLGLTISTMWCLFLLGHHPDVQEKVFEEVASDTLDYITFEELRNLKYLDCIVKESFRLYPTAPLFARYLPKEFPSGKYKIPGNSTVVFTPYLVHRIPSVFPDPEKFDPERFMEPNSKINGGNYVPFAEGIRSCLGKNFVMMAMKVFLCHIIRNFRIISLDRREDIELSFEVLMVPAKDLNIKFVPRERTF